MTALAVRGMLDPDRMPDWYSSRTAYWTPWDDDGLRSDAVRKSVIVFACATFLADAVSEANLTVERETKNEWEPAEDRPGMALESLLNHPNPHMAESELLALLVVQMAVQGYAVVEKVRNRGGLPVELWPLRPDWLAQRRNANGTGWTYEYRAPGTIARPVPVDDLVFIPWRHDDRMERHGVSPVIVAAREIGIDAALTDFLKVFLDSGGIPPFVLMHDDPIYDDAIVETMQEKWAQKYGGFKAYGKLPVLHGGYRLESIGNNINDMAWPDLRGITELKICQAFRVPPDLVGASSTFKSGNLSTTEADGAMEQLQRYGAAPLRKGLTGALGRGLLPEFVGSDRGYRIYADTSDILALQEDEDAKHARAREDWNSGLLMLDEARQAIGREDVPNKQGQVFKVPFSTTLVSVDQLIEPETTITEVAPLVPPLALPLPPKSTSKALLGVERTYRDIETLSGLALEVRNRSLQRTQRDRAKLVQIGTRHMSKFFKDQKARLIENLLKAGPGHETRDIANIDWQEEELLLVQVLQRFYMANGEAAFEAFGDITGIDSPVWDVSNLRVLRLVDSLGLRIVGISETTRVDVVERINQGLIEGDSIAGLSERIQGLYEETYKGRSETIARTESMVAYGEASALAYVESGEVDEVEVHDNSLHTESYSGAADGMTCAQRDGIVVPLANAGFHIRSDHPNGSVAISPILRTPLGA